jgi:CRP-like cAMP-binding protein
MAWFASTTRARAQQLSKLDLFADLSRRELRKVARAGSPLRVPPQEPVVLEDEIAEGAYLVLSGSLRVHRVGELVRTLSTGDIIGEIGLVAGRRTATVTAETESQLLYFSPSVSETLYEEVPAIRNALEQVARKRQSRDLHTE